MDQAWGLGYNLNIHETYFNAFLSSTQKILLIFEEAHENREFFLTTAWFIMNE